MENENLTTGENIENKGIDTTGINSDGTNANSNGTANEGININANENTIPNVEVISNSDNNSDNVTEINIDNNVSVNNNEVVSTDTEENSNNDMNADNVSASKGGVFANALEDAVKLHADVINMCCGLPRCYNSYFSDAYVEAIDAAFNAGITVCRSVGNDDNGEEFSTPDKPFVSRWSSDLKKAIGMKYAA